MLLADICDLKKELWLRKREALVWRTKEGKLIPLKEMTTEHIQNAIRYFEEQTMIEEIILENSDRVGE